jgi:hypothetical protein
VGDVDIAGYIVPVGGVSNILLLLLDYWKDCIAAVLIDYVSCCGAQTVRVGVLECMHSRTS